MQHSKVDNNLQDAKKEKPDINGIILESLCFLGNFFLFFVKLTYYSIEALYRKIVPLPPMDVKGEIVLITGTGHGIGKELALVYSKNGATIVGWDVNKKNGDETIREINSLPGRPKAYSFQCDVTNRQQVLDTAKEVQSKVGKVTILINNAGIMPTHPLEQQTPEEIEKTIAINLTAHFWLLQAFLPSMKQNNYGHIVSIASLAGMTGFANLVPYCGTKFAVCGYMEALFQELRYENPNNKINITVVCPYIVETGLCKNTSVKYPNLMPELAPKDVANAIFNGQTHGKILVGIPGHLLGVTLFGRLLPQKAAVDLSDTLGVILKSDL